MLIYALVSFALVFVSRPLFLIIAPPDYSSAYTVVFLMLPGIAFIGVYCIGESLLAVKNRTTLIGGIVILFTLLSLAINYLLIPLWGIYGAIFVFNVTVMLTAVSLLALAMKVFPIRIERRLGAIGALFFFFLFFVFLLRGAPPYIYYTVIPLMAVFSLALLYQGKFFDEQERATINAFFQELRSRVSSRQMMAD